MYPEKLSKMRDYLLAVGKLIGRGPGAIALPAPVVILVYMIRIFILFIVLFIFLYWPVTSYTPEAYTEWVERIKQLPQEIWYLGAIVIGVFFLPIRNQEDTPVRKQDEPDASMNDEEYYG